jgi:hypothetical protein
LATQAWKGVAAALLVAVLLLTLGGCALPATGTMAGSEADAVVSDYVDSGDSGGSTSWSAEIGGTDEPAEQVPASNGETTWENVSALSLTPSAATPATQHPASSTFSAASIASPTSTQAPSTAAATPSPTSSPVPTSTATAAPTPTPPPLPMPTPTALPKPRIVVIPNSGSAGTEFVFAAEGFLPGEFTQALLITPAGQAWDPWLVVFGSIGLHADQTGRVTYSYVMGTPEQIEAQTGAEQVNINGQWAVVVKGTTSGMSLDARFKVAYVDPYG